MKEKGGKKKRLRKKYEHLITPLITAPTTKETNRTAAKRFSECESAPFSTPVPGHASMSIGLSFKGGEEVRERDRSETGVREEGRWREGGVKEEGERSEKGLREEGESNEEG